jgi:hypothetical protein
MQQHKGMIALVSLGSIHFYLVCSKLAYNRYLIPTFKNSKSKIKLVILRQVTNYSFQFLSLIPNC